jgi:hypothetical protein
MGRALCVACRLRVGGLSAQTPRANSPRQKHNQPYKTPKPYETTVGSVLYVVVMCVPCCVSPPGCSAAGRKPTNKQPNQCNNTTNITQHNTHTIHNACRCIVVCGVCCVLRVACGLLGCRAKPHAQTTQGNNATNITQHPNHTKRLSDQY